MSAHSLSRLIPLLVLTAGFWAGLCFGQAEPAESAAAVVPGGDLESMTAPLLRMVASLALVLALVGAFAWLAKRFRGGQMQGGLIQIVSGLSLGPKDRVVLLRVGQEEVLVGLSPTGMRALHVMDKPTSGSGFSLAMSEGMSEQRDAGPSVKEINPVEQG